MTQILKRPQRLAPSPPPGSLLKRAFDLHSRIRLREVTQHDPVYLERIRQMPCLKCGMEPPGIEAAHLRSASGAHGKASGIGKKPDDRWCLSLCSSCHRDQHQIGERAFWSEIGIDPFLVAQRLYAARGDIVAMRAVVLRAIAERMI